MAYKIDEAANIYDVMEALNTLLTANGWVVVESDTVGVNIGGTIYTKLNYAIWQGIGDGTDKIYIQCRIPEKVNGSTNFTNMYMDSMAGYDEHLYYYEQPGSIQQWLHAWGDSEVAQPMLTVTGNERFYYWIFCDSYRVIIVTRMSIVYEAIYLGFITPISSERQYPYPVYVAGNGVATGNSWPNNGTGSGSGFKPFGMVFPHHNSGYLRRADGTWRAFDAVPLIPSYNSIGTVFPYNTGNKMLVPNYKEYEAVEQDNFLLIPVMLQTTNPVDVNGILRDVYWISGTRDVASEQIVTYEDSQYIIFDTKMERDDNSYFAIKMF